MNRRLRDVQKLARSFDRSVQNTRNGHLKLVPPHLPALFTPGSPSDWRSLRKLRADLQRAQRH